MKEGVTIEEKKPADEGFMYQKRVVEVQEMLIEIFPRKENIRLLATVKNRSCMILIRALSALWKVEHTRGCCERLQI